MAERPPRARARHPLDHEPAALRTERIKAGKSLTELAEAAGISKGYLSELEKGTRNPSPHVLGRLARELRCEVADLMAKQAA